MPVAHWERRGRHGGPTAVALLDGFEQILLLTVAEAAKTKIVDDKDGYFGEALEEPVVGAFGTCLDEVV